MRYAKDVLSKIRQINPEDIFTGVEIETNEMPLVLLNLEIIANEVKKDLAEDSPLPDKKTIRTLLRPILKKEFSLKSPKFVFAFKMAFMLFIWQLLTLMFNLPFTKWLYFITLPLMMPYVNDLASMAKARIKGTFLGVFIFAVILVLIPYIPISAKTVAIILFVACIFVLVLKMEDKFILTTASTIMSVMTALIYINPPEALVLKLLWVVVGVVAVSIFNFKFLPYSVEAETRNCFKMCCEFNGQYFDLIKEKCRGVDSDRKTALLVLTNIVRENIQVTDENMQLYDLQIKITDICNFILNYLDVHSPSEKLKNNLICIIDKDYNVDDNLDVKDNIIAHVMLYIKGLYEDEKAIMRDLK